MVKPLQPKPVVKPEQPKPVVKPLQPKPVVKTPRKNLLAAKQQESVNRLSQPKSKAIPRVTSRSIPATPSRGKPRKLRKKKK